MTAYLIEFEDGKKRKITVPDDWKVTFGPAFVGKDTNRPTGQRYKVPMAIRFYKSKDNQRAIFTNVVGFRDLSIPIEEEVTHTKEKQGYTEVDGKRKATSFQVKVKEWVNPDIDLNLSEKPQIEWED